MDSQKDLPADRQDLPKPELDFPKPEMDLPLPEKEIPSSSSEKSETIQTPSESVQIKSDVDSKYSDSKFKWIILFIIIILILVLLSAGGFFFLNQSKNSEISPSPTPNQVVCTQEAMLCPDGKTYVSRVGPNCEFAKCPKMPKISPEENAEVSPVPSITTSTSSSNLQ